MVTLLLNFVVILIAILLFMAPFYWWFRRNDRLKIRENDSINRKSERFFSSKQANFLVMAWAFGEALVWFVIPEFLLLLAIFMRTNHKKDFIIYDLYGTTLGVIAAYMIHLSYASIAQLPYIKEGMVAQVQFWFDSLGIWGLLHQPFSGVPFKVFNFVAVNEGFMLFTFIIVAIVVRMARYVILYGFFIAIYPVLHKFVKRNYVPLFLGAILVFSAMLLKVYNSY